MRKLRFRDVFQTAKVNKDSISKFQTSIHVSLLFFFFFFSIVNEIANIVGPDNSHFIILFIYLNFCTIISLSFEEPTISQSQVKFQMWLLLISIMFSKLLFWWMRNNDSIYNIRPPSSWWNCVGINRIRKNHLGSCNNIVKWASFLIFCSFCRKKIWAPIT